VSPFLKYPFYQNYSQQQGLFIHLNNATFLSDFLAMSVSNIELNLIYAGIFIMNKYLPPEWVLV
jgi:hypothetical protein